MICSLFLGPLQGLSADACNAVRKSGQSKQGGYLITLSEVLVKALQTLKWTSVRNLIPRAIKTLDFAVAAEVLDAFFNANTTRPSYGVR